MRISRIELRELKNRTLITELCIGLRLPNSTMPFNVLRSYMKYLKKHIEHNKDKIIYLDGVMKDVCRNLG